MDHLVVGFLIYAVLFRLAVIATGVVAIVLGYKLFLRGVMGEGGTNVNAQAGQIKLTLHNAGPGGIFALFGALIIMIMLFQGSPELRNATQLEASQSKQEMQMKSGKRNESNSEALQRFERACDNGVQHKRDGDIEGAIIWYNKALAEYDVPLGKTTDVFNELAWIYREQHRIDEALAVAHIATTVDQNNANAFDTLALILLSRKELQAAEQAAEKAVNIDPDKQDYKNTLQQVRAAKEAGQ